MKNMSNEMYVIKRNNKKEIISFDKILKRIKLIGKQRNLTNIIYAQVTMKVIDQLHDNIKTSQIDELTAEECASLISQHPEYSLLASAILMSNLHKNTTTCFLKTIKILYNSCDKNNIKNKNIDIKFIEYIEENIKVINSMFVW